MDISGASAIVTGGASGIGAAVVRQLAAKGAKVVVADLNAEKGEALAKDVGGVFVSVDVTKTDQNEKAVAAAIELGPLRYLVNSAGIGWAQRTIGRDGEYSSAFDLDSFRKVIDINLIGSFDMLRLAATKMSLNEADEDGQKGAIVNMASVAAFDGVVFSEIVRPRLTTVRQDTEEIGKVMALKLIESIERGEKISDVSIVASEVVWADSVKDLRTV